MNKKVIYFILVIVVVVIGLFVVSKLLKDKMTNESEVVNTPNEEVINPHLVSVNELIVPDQAPGQEVFIEKVSFKTDGDGGFVVISSIKEEVDNQVDNQEGPSRVIIGISQYFSQGTILENFIVKLKDGLEETAVPVVGDTVVVSLYKKADQTNLDSEPMPDVELGGFLVGEQGKPIEVFFKILDNLETTSGFEAKI